LRKDQRETTGQITSKPEDDNPYHKKQQIAVGAGAEAPARTPRVFNDAEAEGFLNYLHQERKQKKGISAEIIEEAIEEWVRRQATKKQVEPKK